jgi:outer membrane protein OmpA-like peptidoglycan-associated protein
MGAAEGTYTITAHVDDGKGGAASCSSTVQVAMKPIRPPTVALSADRNTILPGERVHITSTVGNPDNAPLTYMWRANGGMVVGNGAAVDWDSTGLMPGPYSITLRVENSAGAADASVNIQVQTPPPPPQASKISDCAFKPNLNTRIDNVCKRVLDDVALRLQNEPRANIVIIGYSDPRERNGNKVAGDRAANAVKYLGEKGVAASRAQTRTGTGQTGATDNRRIDVIWVPEGATY